MGSLQELKQAVGSLSSEDLAAFRAWFASFDAAQWDRQFEADVAAGRLDSPAAEAVNDLQSGRCTDL